MAGNPGDSAVANALSDIQPLTDHVALSQRVQSLALSNFQHDSAANNDSGRLVSLAVVKDAHLAAPVSNWDKFTDVTEDGFKDIPQGIWHSLHNGVGLAENAAISVGAGVAAKVLLPETGPLGKLCAVGLGVYFAEQSAVPVYKAYSKGMQAKTMGDIHLAGNQVGDALGGLAVNVPIGIVGYKFGAGIGEGLMASPKMARWGQMRDATLDPINTALASRLKTAREGIAGIFSRRSAGAEGLEAKGGPPSTGLPDQTGTPDGKLNGHIEATEKPEVIAVSDAAASPVPKLPDRYQPVQETFSGKTVPGISPEFLKNLQTDDTGQYYGAGLRYPDVMADPEMAQYLQGHNQLTMASVDKAIYDQELALEAKASSYKLPADWESSAPPANAIDVTDGGDGTMRVGSRTFSLTDDGAPNRKVVVSDDANPGGTTTFIPEPKDFEIQQIIQATASGADRFALVGSQDGASVLHLYDEAGNPVSEITLPGFGTLHDVRQGASPSQLQFLYDTPIAHPRVLTVDTASGQSSLSPLSSDVFNTDNYVTEKIMVPWTDLDGKPQTSPVFLSHSKDMIANGQNSAYYKIYGGFDVGPQYIEYSPSTASWLERGGVAVDPVLPGDGGLGSGNYQEGTGADLKNDDLALKAIIAKLHDMGITSPQKTGIYGRSNGGARVNTLLNSNSDIVGAAVSESGVNSFFDSPVINVDTGRYWTPNFGDPTNPDQVSWMSQVDPLTNLSPARQYPPTLIEIGTKDGVVNVGNGITLHAMREKMGNGEIRLFARIGEGHDPVNLNLALQTAFLWHRLNLPAT